MERLATISLGDKSTSDVIVRIQTYSGQTSLVYSHSQLLSETSQYFAECILKKMSKSDISRARICIDLPCKDSDIDYIVSLLRLFYYKGDDLVLNSCHNVKNAVGILKVASDLGCPKFVTIFVNYLEAVPWGENEEDEVLQIIPKLGSQAEPILARLQPVKAETLKGIFLSAVQFAMSSPPMSINELKICAQEQVEYMITDDQDSPMVTPDEKTKEKIKMYSMELLERFKNLLDANLSVDSDDDCLLMISYLSDTLWICKILTNMDMMNDVVKIWVDESEKILEVVGKITTTTTIVETKHKIVEILERILHTVDSGCVVLTTCKRVYMITSWLPFVRATKRLLDSAFEGVESDDPNSPDGEIWLSLQNSFVAIILTLPSENQAYILTEWLQSESVAYPDLTEAFEMWCHRSKIAKRRIKNEWFCK